jgi:hypothetical protein
VAADLSFVRVNGGRAFAHLVNWDEAEPPALGQFVVAADGGSERMEALIVEIRQDGTLVLSIPKFARTAAYPPNES